MPHTRPSQRLQALAEDQATKEHARRLAELKELAPLLARLDELVPELAKRGLTIFPNDLSLTFERLGLGYAAPRKKAVRLMTCWLSTSDNAHRWLVALQELGFRVAEGPTGTVCPTALLRLGHLYVRVDLTAADAALLLAETKAAVQKPAEDAQPRQGVAA